MSKLDNELAILTKKIAALEEQKRIEEEEKKKTPFQILEKIIDEKKKLRDVLKDCPRTGPSLMPKSHIPISTEEFEWLCDQNDKKEFLEPILLILQSFDERIKNLEKMESAKKDTPMEDLLS